MLYDEVIAPDMQPNVLANDGGKAPSKTQPTKLTSELIGLATI
jgi:hypothetical protein